MRPSAAIIALALLTSACPLAAQEAADSAAIDSVPGITLQDSLQAEVPEDSLRAEVVQDSLEAEIARELGADTAAAAAAAPPLYGAPPPGQGAAQSLNPDLSVIGDFLSDLSPERSTLEGGDRFQMREVEIGLQAAVDPYFRGDFFVALKEGEIELEEGYLTTLALPQRFQAKLGRFHLPYGKVNLTHRPEIHTIEYPHVVQEFFGDDGFATSGLWVGKILSPFGFYQEIIGVVGNDLGPGIRGGEEPAETESEGDEGQDLLEDLGDRLFLGHLKNYVDVSEAGNLEIGLSVATGTDRPAEPSAERLTFYGIDAIYRWRPPAASLYRSLILQAESSWREGSETTDFGGFLFGQYQIGRRWYVGARYDHVEHPGAEPRERENSISAYLTLYPSEFSLFRLGYEHRDFENAESLDRLLVQTSVTLGPHRPHPF